MHDNNQNNEQEKEKDIENKDEPKKTHSYSEIITNQIIKKIISLVMTDSLKNKVVNQIPNYCFEYLKQSIETLTYLDFLVYDKDDIEIKHHLIIGKNKSSINIKSNTFLQKDKNDNDKSLNKSEIIRKYKFSKKMDPKITDDCSIDLDLFKDFNYEKNGFEKSEKIKGEEKIIMKFLVREKYKDKKTSFEKEEEKKRKIIDNNNRNYNFTFNDDKAKIFSQICCGDLEPFKINSEENIDIIKKVENHKIYLSPKRSHKFKKKIPFDTKTDSINFWNTIEQPHAPSIDRDAGTKIKYEKPRPSLIKKKAIQPPIIEEQITSIRNQNS
jgi:hypothetical protein